MSFLGSYSLYIINLSSLNSSNKDSYINFIKQYKGPNSLICFIDNKEVFNNIIDLDELIKKDVNSIFNFLDLPKVKSKIVSPDKLSIDEQIILHYYCMCLGRDSKGFESQWLSKIIKSEGSLFDLSSYFFSKNRVQFFNLWSKLENTYSDMFWISFWSEQLFKAFFYIKYRNNNDLIAAKKISYRLPFSFIQKDWKFLDINSLALAHKDIYDLDYCLKNGASNISLDLFFGNYFSPLLWYI